MSLAETNGAMKNYISSIPQPPNPPQHNLEFFLFLRLYRLCYLHNIK